MEVDQTNIEGEANSHLNEYFYMYHNSQLQTPPESTRNNQNITDSRPAVPVDSTLSKTSCHSSSVTCSDKAQSMKHISVQTDLFPIAETSQPSAGQIGYSTEKVTTEVKLSNVSTTNNLLNALSHKKNSFLLEHDDPYLVELGYAFCNVCRVKVKWTDTKTVSDHIVSARHAKAEAKIALRLQEFTWLRLHKGVPTCGACQVEVAWRNATKLRDHEETPEHNRSIKTKSQPVIIGGNTNAGVRMQKSPTLALSSDKDFDIIYDDDISNEAPTAPSTADVKMEITDDGGGTSLNVTTNKILIQNKDVGSDLVEALARLRKRDTDTVTEVTTVRIVCADGVLTAHLEPLLLFTHLFTCLNADTVNHFDSDDAQILYPDACTDDVMLALDVMYSGKCVATSGEQRDRVSRCLADMSFIGVPTGNGIISAGWKERAAGVNRPSKLYASNTLVEENQTQISSNKLLPTSDVSKSSEITIAMRLKQFPDLQQIGDNLVCRFCPEAEGVDLVGTKRLNQHMKSTKHLSAKMSRLQEDGKNAFEVNGDDFIDDGDVDIDNEEIHSDEEDPSPRKKRSGVSSRISLETRLRQFPDLAEFEGQVICKVCLVVLDWSKRSRISEHMRSQKHIRSNSLNIKPKEISELSDSERLKVHVQAQRLNNCLKKKDHRENSTDDEYEDDTDIPFQEKLVQRMQEFPWMKKLPRVDEVRCIFCRCPVNWERKSHILDHIKSKKHLTAIDAKKDRYPDIIRKMEQVKPKYAEPSEKPNNGDRLAYRIHLRQGTPAIQKLWGAALIIGTMTTQISMCYICFKLYLTADQLLNHSNTEHKGTPNKVIHSPLFNKETKEFFCNGCNKYTEAKKSLMCFLVHNLICTKKFYTSSLPLKCFKCDEKFTQYKNFREHIEETHEVLLPERLMCTECPQTYLTNEELKRHINQVHTEHIFACSQCPSTFKNKNSLKEHVVKHHIGVKNFSCDTCGKEFYGKQNLRMHMRIHVAPEQRPHACSLCGMRFIERKHLTNHQATHTNDRPHKCAMCDSRFKVRDWLSNHYIKQHSVSIKEVEAKYRLVNNSVVPSATAQYYHHQQ